MSHPASSLLSHKGLHVPPLPSAVSFSSWILLDKSIPDRLGSCVRLSEALGIQSQFFSVFPRTFFSYLPKSFHTLQTLTTSQGSFCPPWPHFILCSGGFSAIASSLIRQKSKGQTFVAALGNPHIPASHVDLLISTSLAPFSGSAPNILKTLGAFPSITPAQIQNATHKAWKTLSALPQPWIGVCLSPPENGKLSASFLTRLARDLVTLVRQTGGGLMISLPKTTPPALRSLFAQALGDMPHRFWDEDPEAILGMADFVILNLSTGSLLSNALLTDKPLYIYATPSKGGRHEKLLQEQLFKDGHARPFQGSLHFWSRAPFSETESVARKILDILTSSQRAT